jgi:hypothetical protein
MAVFTTEKHDSIASDRVCSSSGIDASGRASILEHLDTYHRRVWCARVAGMALATVNSIASMTETAARGRSGHFGLPRFRPLRPVLEGSSNA